MEETLGHLQGGVRCLRALLSLLPARINPVEVTPSVLCYSSFVLISKTTLTLTIFFLKKLTSIV